jgi:hypothetical protein
MFHLEVRFRLRGTIVCVEGRECQERRKRYTLRAGCLQSFSLSPPSRGPRLANFLPLLRCDTLALQFNHASDLGDTMTYDSHQRAAEFHMLAAHAHQAAAVHHGKEDHLTAHEQSRQAMEYASKAFEFSKQAHDESSVIFRKQEKKA